MYPLLISGVASVASNLIDRWSQASARASAAKAVKFDELLKQATGPAGTATSKVTPSSTFQSQVVSLRAQLLDSPEVRSLLGTCDPTQPPTLHLSPDGKLSAQSANGESKSIALTPETAALARQLSALTASGPLALPASQPLAALALRS